MTPKKLLTWIILSVIAYQLFGYVKTHTTGDVVAYKRFAKAIKENDDYIIRNSSNSRVTGKVLNSQTARTELFRGAKVVFTYYVINERRLAEEGKIAYISADQVSRINPEGFDTLWGEVELRIPQSIQLVLEKGVWTVAEYHDQAIKP